MGIDRPSGVVLGIALGIAVAVGWIAGRAPDATAQVVCRSNSLGVETCMGLPAPSNRGADPFARRGRGLSGVQPPVGADSGPALVPARRTGALGATILGAGDLPPGRPPLPGVAPVRDCRRDTLGNLLCD